MSHFSQAFRIISCQQKTVVNEDRSLSPFPSAEIADGADQPQALETHLIIKMIVVAFTQRSLSSVEIELGLEETSSSHGSPSPVQFQQFSFESFGSEQVNSTYHLPPSMPH